MQAIESIQPCMASPNASDVVNVFLCALAETKATVLWIDPILGGEAHEIVIEKNLSPMRTCVIRGGLGDAAMARLALLARLDLLARGIQNGRLKARAFIAMKEDTFCQI